MDWQSSLRNAATRKHNNHVSPEDVPMLQHNYAKLAAKTEIVAIRESVHNVIATWDDHDLGRNDNGATYAHRDISRDLFLRFWRGGEGTVDPVEARGLRRGVYEVYKYSAAGRPMAIVQVIMLDCRYFRADNVPVTDKTAQDSACMPNTPEPPEYCQHSMNAGSTLLGEEQWAWLEEQLLDDEPIIRLIGSSLQFAAEYHGMEAWGLHPAEQQRPVRCPPAEDARERCRLHLRRHPLR
jgi:alkaline phosphatase D